MQTHPPPSAGTQLLGAAGRFLPGSSSLRSLSLRGWSYRDHDGRHPRWPGRTTIRFDSDVTNVRDAGASRNFVI